MVSVRRSKGLAVSFIMSPNSFKPFCIPDLQRVDSLPKALTFLGAVVAVKLGLLAFVELAR